MNPEIFTNLHISRQTRLMGNLEQAMNTFFFYFMFQIGSDIRLKYLFVLRAVEVIIIDVSREKRAWINCKVENIF